MRNDRMQNQDKTNHKGTEDMTRTGRQEHHARGRKPSLLLLILSLIAVLLILFLAVVPVFRLRQAQAALESGDYDTAISIYQHYGSRYNADTLLLEAEYQKAAAELSNENYDEAVSLFSVLGDYKDSAGKLKEALIGQVQVQIEGGAYNEALDTLSTMDETCEGRDDLILSAKFGRAELLAGVGKLDNAEAELEALGEYEGAKELLASVRYNLAIDYLQIFDFDNAQKVLEKTGNVSNASELLSLLSAPFDGIYTCTYTDSKGSSEPDASSYLWMHSVILTGTNSVVLGASEDFSVGEPDPSFFGYDALTYVYYQQPDTYTYLFSYGGSENDSDSGENCYIKVVFAPDFQSLSTSIVSADTLEEVSHPRSRTWTIVTDTSLQETIRQGFRAKISSNLAIGGNLYFADATDDPSIRHTCCVENCYNKGTMVAEDATSRSWYCDEHKSDYDQDPRVTKGS